LIRFDQILVFFWWKKKKKDKNKKKHDQINMITKLIHAVEKNIPFLQWFFWFIKKSKAQ